MIIQKLFVSLKFYSVYFVVQKFPKLLYLSSIVYMWCNLLGITLDRGYSRSLGERSEYLVLLAVADATSNLTTKANPKHRGLEHSVSGRVVQETMGNLLFGKLPCKLLCKLPFLQG